MTKMVYPFTPKPYPVTHFYIFTAILLYCLNKTRGCRHGFHFRQFISRFQTRLPIDCAELSNIPVFKDLLMKKEAEQNKYSADKTSDQC